MNMDQVIAEEVQESSINDNSARSASSPNVNGSRQNQKSSQRVSGSISPLHLGEDSSSSKSSSSDGKDLLIDKLPVNLRKKLVQSHKISFEEKK
jgi:hypothetical protein